MGTEKRVRLAELTTRAVVQPAVGAAHLPAQHLAELVDERRDAVIPGLEQDDAQAFVRRGYDQRDRLTPERGAQVVRYVAERTDSGVHGDLHLRRSGKDERHRRVARGVI